MFSEMYVFCCYTLSLPSQPASRPRGRDYACVRAHVRSSRGALMTSRILQILNLRFGIFCLISTI